MADQAQDFERLSPLQRAVFALREATAQLDALKYAQREPVAIVGMGCRFPGGADPAAFWELLARGGDAIREVPRERWDVDAYYDPDPDAPGKMYSRSAGFIDRVDAFDPAFFGISPREAISIDPQQRLLLEVCWEALEHAGQSPEQLRGSRTGVFVGIMTNDYFQKQMALNDPRRITPHFGTGGGNCFAAGRISHFLGVQGPSMPIDTACSSSLVTVHLACRSLRMRECDMALAGGVNLILAPGTSVCMAKLRAISEDGRCKAFDASADGYGRGEGCGVVVLKRLSDAIAHRDSILGVIRGSAVNHDGPSGGLTLPNGHAQQAVAREALAQAGLRADDIDFVEVHGTGTALGDPIEVHALAAVLCQQRSRPLVMGTVKTNIGHLEAAAGVAGLIKVLLSLQHDAIPPHLHLRQRNAYIAWDQWPLEVPESLRSWPRASKPRAAALNTYGLSGTNAHVIVQEAPAPALEPRSVAAVRVLTLSARDPVALVELAKRYAEHLKANDDDLEDVCYTSNVGRAHFNYRWACAVNSREECIRSLEKFVDEGPSGLLPIPSAPPKRAFCFPDEFDREVAHEVAVAFVAGAAIDWDACHRDFAGRRVPLPTYPFQRRRYWLDDEIGGSAASPSGIHPLLGQRLRSPDLQETVFDCRMEATPFLRDHQIHGVTVLSASTMIEILLAGASRLCGAQEVELDGLVFHRPLILHSGNVRNVQTIFASESVRLVSIAEDEQEWTTHATATYRNADSGSQSEPEPLASIQARMVESVPADAVYDACASRNIQLGPNFRRLQSVRRGEGEFLAGIGAVEAGVRDDNFVLPPGVLDACFQILAWENSRLVSPSTVERLSLTRSVPGPLWCHARDGRLCLYSDSGDPLATLTGVEFREVEPTELGSRGSRQAGNLLLRMEWMPHESAETDRAFTGEWLILSDRAGLGSALEESLRTAGASCRSVRLETISPAVEEVERTIDQIVVPWLRDRETPQGIVYLWTVDATLPSPEALACAAPLRLLQCVTRSRRLPVPVYFATCGVHRLSNDTFVPAVAQAPLWGLARVAMQEHQAHPITCIDLDPATDAAANARALLNELQQSGSESQIARRNGLRYIARLVEIPADEGRPFVLQTSSHESLDQLRRVPLARRAPAANEVEIRVEASGLNFRDVLNVLGQYPGDAGPLGGECVGRVVAVGADVTEFAPGQSVIAIGPACFASHVTTRHEFVVAKPELLDVHEAATLPIAFLTACLAFEWAQLRHDESVLIHAATGGVGMAAVQIARQRGAIIHATAGNNEKRDLLRRMGISYVYDSRKTDFADEILRNTGGRGVDVVLNSLAGDFIAASVRALASDGRFVEIGKASILSGEEFARVRPSGRYCAFALDQLAREDLVLVGTALRKTVQQVKDGELQPLPVRVFPIAQSTEAFRTMAQARHIGKIVLSQTSDSTRTSATVAGDATYIITGGMGGLGMLLARRLVEWGARALLLAGRKAPGAATLARLQELSTTGATVVPYQADVASAEDVARLLAHAAATMPAVRGIFHLAGVLDDGPLAQQTWPRFSSVLAPKLRGAWNLHQQTAHLPLDHFVVFSSAASILGSEGQGTYAAANAFLDALAQFRQASGLPALSINWGPWAQAGMAARLPPSARRWSQQGIAGIETQAGLQIMADLLAGKHAQCAVLHVNKAKLCRALAASNVAVFERLLGSGQDGREPQESELRRILRESPPNQRQARVQEVVQRAVMRVLGLAPDQAVAPRRAFRELGLDSLLAVDLVHSLGRAWGKPLSPALLFRHSDVESLARYFVDEFVPAVKPPLKSAEAVAAATGDFIAIVGMGCRFPGGANDPESFWELLRSSTDAIVEVPSDRWPIDSFYDPDPDVPGKMYTRWGGFVKDVDRFDPAFFDIAPGEALSMDPQQRLFLEVAWEALENAGIPADGLAGTETGVFLGISTGDYSTLTLGGNDPAVVDAFFGTGSAACIAAGRLSYLLGLKGPNLALDTGCSSSLVALHLACQSLRSGECRVALAGGVNLILSPIATIYFCKLHAMARDGRCKTFSAQADGFVRGEGCGVVVLKRLSDAIADGDRIEAIVRGTAMNHDGRSNGLTAPNAAAQAEVIERCLQAAGLTPHDISYIEAHGSGTALGDPVECSAITEVFGKEPRGPLALGAVKSNIGHLEAAAGVAGLIKLVLTLQHGEIPANLHCDERNPRIDWQQMPLLVPRSHQQWPVIAGPRRGGVSSFSFSGTNIHAILEASPSRQSQAAATAADRPKHILTLSAQSGPALQELIARYIEFIQEHSEVSLADICFSANTGRSVFAHRVAAVAESGHSMIAALKRSQGVIVAQPANVGFFFPDTGEFPAGLGTELFAAQPAFAAAIAACDSLLQSEYGFSILPVFRGEPAGNRSRVALFCFETALAQLLKAWGTQPDSMAGEGAGAVAAAYIDGTISLADALRRVLDGTEASAAAAAVYDRRRFVYLGFTPGRDWDHVLEILSRLYLSGVSIDWRAFDRDYSRQRLRLPNYPFQRQRYWLDNRTLQEKTGGHRPPLQQEAKTPLVQELESLSPARRLPRIHRWLKEHVASVLSRSPESLPDGSAGFFEMGLDSLKAIELAIRVRGDLGDRIALTSTLTFDYPNLDALAGFITDSFVPHAKEGEARRLTIDRDEPVAVIGIGCRFPGEADGPERFWNMLREGCDAIRPVPVDRWSIDHWYDPDPEAPGKMYCARGAFLPRVDLFDAWFFGISPREANYLDPQQRLLLEVTWEAFEHAALAPQRLAGSRTGVFVGISGNEYMHRIGVSDNDGSAYIGVGNSPSAAAGRLSYVLGFQGPSLVVDTACSSSLVAVHEACQSLRTGESDHAIAAGVNVLLSPWAQVNLCQARMLAPDGQCKTFSAAADGYGRGEGCGVVILKRLSDAIRDKDTIYAVLRASGVNQDGRSSGLTVPNGPAQQSLIRDVLARARVSPNDVDYVEAHGTGTSLGDPIELHALAATYGAGRPMEQALRVGSVKTNIGHLEAAAGIAGLIKVILALNHEVIPAHLHCDQPSDRVAWDQLPMVINREPVKWTRNGRPRRAAVSSFGFVGTNAHVLVEEAPAEDRWPGSATEPQRYLLALSAKDEGALDEIAARLREHLKSHSELDLADVSRTLTLGRSHFEYRRALVVSSIDEACALLARRAWLTKDSPAHDSEEQLATAYMNGEDIDWAGYWSERAGRSVALPTYAFQRQRYWIEESDPKQQHRARSNGASAAAPPLLLGRRIPSALEAVQFESHWSSSRLPFLADHRIYDRIVVPGAAYLAMCVAAGKHLGSGAAAQTLKEISFPQSLILPDDQERTVQLIAQPAGAGQYGCRICSLESASENWITHAAAQWTSGDAAAARFTDLSADAPAGTTRVESFYDLTEAGGLRLGPSFQWIDDLWRKPGEAWAAFRIATPADPETPVPPGLIDACFQVLGSAMPAENVASNAFIPVGLETLTLYGPVSGQRLWCRARLRDGQSDQHSSFVGDVCLYDQSGDPRLQLEGVRLQSAPRQALVSTATLPRNASYEVVWRSTPLPAPAGLLQHWVILADKQGFGVKVAERLRASGAECHTIDASPDARERLDALRSVFMLYRGDKVGIISLWALDADGPGAPLEAVASGVLDILQLPSHLSLIERVWLVTAGGQIVSNTQEASASVQAAVWGLGRVVAREYPAWRCTIVDLQDVTTESVTSLVSELQSDDKEDQVAWRADRRYVPRLVPLPLSSVRKFSADEAYALSLRVRGIPDTLELAPCARPSPGPGEIEIGVAAAALNFRDVLNVLDLYPGDPGPLGLECSGTVTAAGEGVSEFRIGDEVLALAPACFSRYALTRQELVAHKPAHLDFEAAAGIPVAFLTASYALERLARLSAGESVLIHLGSGGVGLAAIQVAERLNATVFATAGSGEKRAFLKSLGVRHVFNSRSPAFATAVREVTGGQGVDVVLNSLSDNLWNASIQCLKPNGRFIEIGKIGIKSKAEFHALLPEARYEVFALDDLVRRQSHDVGDVLRDVVERFSNGILQPSPHRTFTLAQAPAALRLMSRARHIGKIVLSGSQTDSIPPDATYLITGGSGGLGQHVAEWLVDQGAKRLVLTSRRPPDESAQTAIARLIGRGVEVSVQQADVGRRGDVARVIHECGPGLRGVFHLAGVIDDAPLSQMNAERWQRVWLPKVMGAWHLHELTRSLPLDFFVLFSSAAAILGAPGQGNYAAANAVMDQLAHERRREGLPAQSISWGPWSEAGIAARLGSKGAERFSRAGVGMLSPSHGIALLDAIVSGSHVQVVAMPLDIEKLQSLAQGQAVPPLFAELVASSADIGDREWIAELQSASPADQRSMVLARIRTHVAAVLGLEAGRTIGIDVPLREIGLDSLMAVELTRRISAEAGRNLPATLLFDYPSLNALAGFVLGEFMPADRTGEVSTEPELSFLETLSSDQLQTMLEDEISLIDDVLRRSEP